MKSNVWLPSSAGPAEMLVAQPFTVCAPAFCETLWLAPLVNDGASFAALTVRTNVSVMLTAWLPMVFVTATVIVAVPF
jgi:hypothetical protein